MQKNNNWVFGRGRDLLQQFAFSGPVPKNITTNQVCHLWSFS